jgi:hypothetical protein
MARQVRVRLSVAEIVDRDDLQPVFPGFVMSAQDVAADAAVPVDRDFDGHLASPG